MGILKQYTVCKYEYVLDQYVSVYSCIYQFIPVGTNMYQYIPVHTSMYQYTPSYTSIYQYVQVYTTFKPVHTSVYQYTPVYTSIYQFTPVCQPLQCDRPKYIRPAGVCPARDSVPSSLLLDTPFLLAQSLAILDYTARYLDPVCFLST